MHKNIPYKIVYKTKQVEKIIEELKEKYTDAKNQLSTSQQMVDRMEKELMEYENECIEIQENIKTNLNNLEKIALNKDSHELTEKYLKYMIINERNEKKEGYNDRIKVLIEFQNNNEILKKLYNQENITLNFEQIKKDYINNEDFDDLKYRINI